ncbi:uncharacterized protein N7484_010463 [Penicillium longicatenatum]|uniref:uncharacterized protein n=1 Tax=Penicillium longicatenatum TaxID=1561947 RepID=UPI0025484FBE|nr:uncharacterized protein N7484_010463 [Penicillium longicatenatum]KAJ5630363.1 hypothetical protein N7484_010463 [Penicillium longicatenatum]
MSSTRFQLHGSYSPSLPGHPAWNILRPIFKASNCSGEDRHFGAATGLKSCPSVLFDFKFTEIDLSICQSIVLDVLVFSLACLKSTPEVTISRIEKFLQFSHSKPFGTAIVLFLEDDSSVCQSNETWWLNDLMELEVM